MDYATGYNIIWFIFRNNLNMFVTGVVLLAVGIVGLIKKEYFYNLIGELLFKYKKVNLKDHMRLSFFAGALYLIIIWGVVLISNVLGWLDDLNGFVSNKIW